MENTRKERDRLFRKAEKIVEKTYDISDYYSDTYNDHFIYANDGAKYQLNEIDEDYRKPQYPLDIEEMEAAIVTLEKNLKYVKHLVKIDDLISDTPSSVFG